MSDYPHCSPETQRIMARWEAEQQRKEDERIAQMLREREEAAARLSSKQQDRETLLERQMQRRYRLELGRQALKPK